VDTDVIVVGSGAAGGWAAKELTEGGLSVLLLEAGRAVQDDVDFAAQPRAASVWGRVLAGMRGQFVQARNDQFTPAFTDGFYVDDRRNPYTTPRGKPFLWIRGRQVGGRLHTWARAALRMSDEELGAEGHQRHPDLDWPISYKDLAPFYDKVETTLGVLGTPEGLAHLPDGRFLPPPPRTAVAERFCRRLQTTTGLRAIRGRIVQYDSSRTPIPLAIAMRTGRLELRPHAIASRVLVDETKGPATGVEYVDARSGTRVQARSRIVMLCASAFESTRLLLNSACSRHPEGLGGSSGVLGRYIADHVMVRASGPLSADMRAPEEPVRAVPRAPYDFGVYGDYIPNFCGRWGRTPDFLGGYGVQLRVHGRSWFGLAFGESLPRRDNRLTIARHTRDAWGIPAAHIDCSRSDNDHKMIDHMKASLAAIGQAGGGLIAPDPGRLQKTLFRIVRPLVMGKDGAHHPGLAIHEIGGARMGAERATSVVNPYGACWDVPNLFVTDGACFVTPGYQNHTLTIMALTVRTCDHILRTLNGKS
jgi:choline dehydrogenase-like flavoprotein